MADPGHRIPQQVSLRASRVTAKPTAETPAGTPLVLAEQLPPAAGAHRAPESAEPPVEIAAAPIGSEAITTVSASPPTGQPAPKPDLDPGPAAESSERPPGGIGILFYEDDPSDMVLAIEQPDGTLLQVPLTEMKAARLRQGLDAQAAAAAFMRHQLAGGNADDYQPPPPTVPDSVDSERFVDFDDEVTDEPEEGHETPSALSRRLKALRDPVGLESGAARLTEQQVRGISGQTLVLGVVAVSFVIVILGMFLSWLT